MRIYYDENEYYPSLEKYQGMQFEQLLEKSESGDKDARFCLGYECYNGDDVNLNWARHWLEQAIIWGSYEAKCYYRRIFYTWEQLEQDVLQCDGDAMTLMAYSIMKNANATYLLGESDIEKVKNLLYGAKSQNDGSGTDYYNILFADIATIEAELGSNTSDALCYYGYRLISDSVFSCFSYFFREKRKNELLKRAMLLGNSDARFYYYCYSSDYTMLKKEADNNNGYALCGLAHIYASDRITLGDISDYDEAYGAVISVTDNVDNSVTVFKQNDIDEALKLLDSASLLGIKQSQILSSHLLHIKEIQQQTNTERITLFNEMDE